MATQQLQEKKQKPIFPDIPRDTKAVDDQGNFVNQWVLAFNNLFQTLQQFFSNEGFGLPVMSLADQAAFAATYQKYIGDPLPPGVSDPTGKRIIDAPYYDSTAIPPVPYNGTRRVPKVFIIEYNDKKHVVEAAWKTYTVT